MVRHCMKKTKMVKLPVTVQSKEDLMQLPLSWNQEWFSL